jgi:hypothetical protein
MSIIDRIVGPPPVSAAEGAVREAAPVSVAPARTFSLPPAGQRELRLDLFRGLALWLIFIDHVSPDDLTWFTIRNYGFSDAAEIFIFISGYTAAFVYGRSMLESGFVTGTARILRRVWQIYTAHVLLFAVLIAEIAFVTAVTQKPFYIEEMGVGQFFNEPGPTMVQALLLRFRPLNMDVLPIYCILMMSLPLVLWLTKWRADLPLVLSGALYLLALHYDLHLDAYPSGFWSFNPFAWQLLFVFGAWCALGGVKRVSGIIRSPVVVGAAFAYVLAAFGVTLTWYFPQLDVIPDLLKRWIYPIDKTDLDILRFLHFVALAVIVVRFVPGDWPGLKSRWLRPMVLCGQHSLQIFCLGVALAFAGYALLREASANLALHALVGAAGILLMSAAAWTFTWYKQRMSARDRKAPATPS